MKNKKTLIIALSCVIVIVILAARFFIAHQVETSGLRDGMTKSEVQELLGDPTLTLNGDSEWYYAGKAWIWCDVTIFFDEDGRYISIFHDH